jgi:hypothetical protein
MSNIKRTFNEFINENLNVVNENNMRSVTVKYENGDVVNTSVAKHLTDEEIRDYFKVGTKVNVGIGPQDNMQTIEEVIINDKDEDVLDLVSSVWDNGGETFDRYTVIFKDGEALGFSHNPTHPQGFSQYLGAVEEGGHLGEEIEVSDLPDEVRKHLIDRLR